MSSLEERLKEFDNIGFQQAIKYLLIAVLFGIIAQNAFNWAAHTASLQWLGIVIPVIILGGFIILFGKSLNRIIDTPYFAISGLLAIALATAVGTFISQNAAPELFTQRYGEHTSNIFRGLHLDQIFHSWWYVILFILLSWSLVKISLRRKLNLPNLGFHLAHLGPVLILFGFWWDYYAGFRGLMQLQTNMDTNLVSIYQKNTNRISDSLLLDFKLKLDYFKSEKFEPDHRIQIWEDNARVQERQLADGSFMNDTIARIISSLPIEINKQNKVYGTDIVFTVDEFYPNFYLNYSYPENMDTIEVKDPGVLLEFINPHGKNLVQLQAFRSGKNFINDPILNVSYVFYWELPAEIRKELDNYSPGSDWAKPSRVIISGKENIIYESHNEVLTTKPIEINTFYPVPGRSKSGFSITHLYPDAAYLESEPATRDQKQENPIAKLSVMRENWSEAKDAFVYPQTSGPGGQYLIPDSKFILALESIRDRETKYWESGLSVMDEKNAVLKQQSIKVNEPLRYKGYRFYQTDYDPNNPNYSGIGVSYTPGLYLIYFGFYVLVLGVFILFYMKSKVNHQLQN